MKISRKAKIRTLGAVGAFVLYGFTGKWLNEYTSKHPGERLTENEAMELIKEEQENFYLKKKVINFVTLRGDFRIPDGNSIAAYASSSKGEFYIVMNEDEIYKNTLYHELGHVIAGIPRKSERTLDESLESAIERGDPTNYSKIRKMLYHLNPEEFFCRIYSLIKD